jgi:uroporphyrinogen decarboxylase
MKPMTSQERLLRTFRHQEVDRLAMVDSPWAGTVQRWYREGMPQNTDWVTYFDMDRVAVICPDNSPRYPHRVIEETDRYIISTTPWGQTERAFRELDSTPETLESYYNTRERWEEAKERMLNDPGDRVPWEGLKAAYPHWEANGYFKELLVWFGFDVTHSHMVGTEQMLLAMYDDPEWLKDMFETYLTVSLNQCQKILDAGYKFDCVFWYDDMGYKGTPFFSPKCYRELLKPYHKRVVDWAHERGMVTELHSCGYIEPLLPDVVDTGVEMLNPIEVKAGMDPQRLKSQWGDKLAFHGGINAQLWDNLELVKEEMRRIIPIMKEGGGYVFASDHSIPSSVSLENMTEIVKLARELGKY